MFFCQILGQAEPDHHQGYQCQPNTSGGAPADGAMPAWLLAVVLALTARRRGRNG